MTREELLKWLKRYDTEEDSYNTGLEEHLRVSFKKNTFMTKPELLQIIEWKFATNKHRKIRQLNLLKNIMEEDVRRVSSAVFSIKEDSLRVKVLMTLPSVGLAVASTVLAFYDPKDYGIYDIWSWRGLIRSKEPKGATWKHLEIFWSTLRKEAKVLGTTCRDLEKAYFKMAKDSKFIS